MKRFLAALLASAMLCGVLTACGNNGESSNGGNDSSSSGEVSQTAQEEPGTREEPVEIIYVFSTATGAMDNQNDVVAAMNEITSEKLNITAELLVMDIASITQQCSLMLSSGEQIDLISPPSGQTSVYINNDYVLDLEEDNLLQTYGQGIIETMGETYIDACRRNGVLYGLPTNRDYATGLDNYMIPAAYLDEIGFDYGEGDHMKVTQEEIEDILGKLHEAYPDKATILPQTGSLQATLLYDRLGGDNYGVLLDPVNSLEVSDLFSSDMYYDYCERWYNWNQLGYISGDSLTNDTASTTQVRTGDLCAFVAAYAPGNASGNSRLAGMELIALQVGDNFLRSTAVSGIQMCIPYTTVDATAAMEYLNELYTNPELSRLLHWGREGYEYVLTEDGHMTYPEGITADTTGYQPQVGFLMPNQFIAGVWEGDPLDLWDQMKEFNDTAIASKALGFTFDNSPVATEYTALANVYNEYQKNLEFGFIDPSVGIPEMVQRMEEAGLDRYIQEKEAQLQVWAEENGVS